jgi:hypothetical protein
MSLILLVFVFGVINVGLGYGLAMCGGVDLFALAGACSPRRSAQPIERSGDGGKGVARRPVPGLPEQQQAAPPPAAPPPAAPKEASSMPAEPERMNLDTLRRFVETSASSLAGFSARLKKNNRGEHVTSGWTLVTELLEMCQPYLEKLRKAADETGGDFGDEVQELVLQQIAQLETTLGNLKMMDFGSDTAAAAGRLSLETASALAMSRKLHAALQTGADGAGRQVSETPLQPLQAEPATPA